MRTMKTLRWFLLPCLIWLAGLHAALGAELAGLLDKVAAAYGEPGRDGPRAVRQTGITYSALRRMEGSLLRAYAPPDRLRIEIRYPGQEEVRTLRGMRAWKDGTESDDAFHGAMVLQAARLALPWSLLAARDRLRDAGLVDMGDGRRLHVLEWDLASGLAMQVAVEPGSGRIVRCLGRLGSRNGVMEFGTVYEDFRHQDGHLYAALERHYAMGRPTGYTRIDRVEYPGHLPDSLFGPSREAPPRQWI